MNVSKAKVGNVSKQADREFMQALEREDPDRYNRLMRNLRRDSPNFAMTESQALTNFMVGLPTGGFRFQIVAGGKAPDQIADAEALETRAAKARLKTRIRQARAMRRRVSANLLDSRTNSPSKPCGIYGPEPHFLAVRMFPGCGTDSEGGSVVEGWTYRASPLQKRPTCLGNL